MDNVSYRISYGYQDPLTRLLENDKALSQQIFQANPMYKFQVSI